MGKLLFTPSALDFVLSAFDHKVNGDGVIVNTLTSQVARDEDGTMLTRDNFGGIIKGKDGSAQFLKNDLLTAIKLTENVSTTKQ